jgi:hypothetical protein
MKPLRDLWNSLKGTPMQIPIRADISLDHVVNYKPDQTSFLADQHYFQVYINEMYLTNEREWFKVYDPMVFVVSEFIYDKKIETVPFVIGSSMLKQFGREIPKGMIFSDTRTIGPTPFRGGNFALAVILYKSARKNYLNEILTLIENVCNIMPVASMIGMYLKTAKVAMSGMEKLLDMGDIVPLVGHRREFTSGQTIPFTPGYYVIMDLPESHQNDYELWVKDRRLFYGNDPQNLEPFRDADYILYSITQSNERDDISTLPFYPLYQNTIDEADTANEDKWQTAKVNLINLYKSLMLSPDLTLTNARSLRARYRREVKDTHDHAVNTAVMGKKEGSKESSLMKEIREESLSMLRM